MARTLWSVIASATLAFTSLNAYAEAPVSKPTPATSAIDEDTKAAVDFTAAHCTQMLFDKGRPDLGFVLGATAMRMPPPEVEGFSRQFANYLVNKYQILQDPPSCKPQLVKMHDLPGNKSAYPTQTARYSLATPPRKEAYLRVALPSQPVKDMPVQLVYRLQTEPGQSWKVVNISFNGQPLVANYQMDFARVYDAVGSKGLVEYVTHMAPKAQPIASLQPSAGHEPEAPAIVMAPEVKPAVVPQSDTKDEAALIAPAPLPLMVEKPIPLQELQPAAGGISEVQAPKVTMVPKAMPIETLKAVEDTDPTDSPPIPLSLDMRSDLTE